MRMNTTLALVAALALGTPAPGRLESLGGTTPSGKQEKKKIDGARKEKRKAQRAARKANRK